MDILFDIGNIVYNVFKEDQANNSGRNDNRENNTVDFLI